MKHLTGISMLTAILLTSVSAPAQDKVVVIPLLKSPPPSTSKMIFVTNGSWTGDLGGLSGADDKCNAEAETRGFSGTFQALLGASSGRPESRSIHYPIPYMSESGSYLQSGYHDLFSSGPDNPVSPQPLKTAWTGLNTDGTLSGFDCDGWTDSSNSLRGTTGDATAVGTTWLDDPAVPFFCSSIFSLYCIEQ